MNHIDKVVYINLNKRPDRRQHIESLLSTYNIPAQRFEAIEHESNGSANTPLHGLYGCGLSHLAVLKLARDNGWRNVMILEDDILFNLPPQEFEQNIERLFAEGPEFDVFMLDINLQRSEPATPYDWLIRVKYAHCAGAYIVQSHYYQQLIDLYEWALPLLLQTGAHWIYANDAVWGELQDRDAWYTFKEQVCRQMAGYSDTKNMYI